MQQKKAKGDYEKIISREGRNNESWFSLINLGISASVRRRPKGDKEKMARIFLFSSPYGRSAVIRESLSIISHYLSLDI